MVKNIEVLNIGSDAIALSCCIVVGNIKKLDCINLLAHKLIVERIHYTLLRFKVFVESSVYYLPLIKYNRLIRILIVAFISL